MSLDVCLISSDGDVLYSAKITHNCIPMAEEAGLYIPIWRPEEVKFSTAIEKIWMEVGMGATDLLSRPSHYKALESSNGLGTYKDFVVFVLFYLEALRKYPEASVHVCR